MANIYPIELIVQKNFKLVCKANKSSSGAQGSEHVPYTLTVDPIYNGYAKEVHVGYVSDSKKIEELCPNGYVTLNAHGQEEWVCEKCFNDFKERFNFLLNSIIYLYKISTRRS